MLKNKASTRMSTTIVITISMAKKSTILIKITIILTIRTYYSNPSLNDGFKKLFLKKHILFKLKTEKSTLIYNILLIHNLFYP